MNQSDLRPAGQFASAYGFKSVVYGPPGGGKTPIINTAPRPVLLACEPGLLSMRGSKVPTYAADTGAKIDDFFKWAFHSAETKNFDTIAVDSVSQMAEIYLQEAIKTKKHGLQAYGDMAKNVMDHLRGLYFLQNKHTYLIAKEQIVIESGMSVRRPYFPGQQLPTEVPHLFDAILHLAKHNVPSVGQVVSFLCAQQIDTMARDRSGRLSEYEQPNFGDLVRKAFQ
jgi:hypothetical protein